MKVLVTGGAGFMGAYVTAALLAKGHDVVSFDLQGPADDLLQVCPDLASRLRTGSVGDADRLLEVCRQDRIEAVVHAAGRVGQAPSVAAPVAFYETNIMGTVNVLDVARRADIRKVVLISSSSVYHGARGTSFTETDEVFSVVRAHPAAHYGVSKMAAEAVAMAYADFHGLDVVALRVAALYGFGMRVALLIKPMVEDAVRGVPTRIPTGGPMRRDYTHILDCSRAIALATGHPALPPGSQRVFNVSAGAMQSGFDLAQVVRRVVPGADIEIGDTLTDLERASTSLRAPLDGAAAGATFGWRPELSIEDGVREYVERFRGYVAAGG